MREGAIGLLGELTGRIIHLARSFASQTGVQMEDRLFDWLISEADEGSGYVLWE